MGEEATPAKPKGIKKTKAEVKKIAKKLWKNKHKKGKQDKEKLLEDNNFGSSHVSSGRSIEVEPGAESDDCGCIQDGNLDHYCEICGRKPRNQHSRHVRFSEHVVQSSQTTQYGSIELPVHMKKKRKKHKKLKKAKKLTWKAMKGSWKFMKAGFGMIAYTPGMPTGPVHVTNIIQNFSTGMNSSSVFSKSMYGYTGSQLS